MTVLPLRPRAGAVVTAAPAPAAAHPPVVPEAARVLVAADDEATRRSLARFLERRGHDVQVAPGTAAALDAIGRAAPGAHALLLCELRRPAAEAAALVATARAHSPHLAIVVLSAAGDAASTRAVFRAGADDVLARPVDPDALDAAVADALSRRAHAIARDGARVAARAAAAPAAAPRGASVPVVEALVTAMEAKDFYLRGRSARVADLAASIAAELGLDEDAVEDVRLAGRLHDVGYIGIPEAILAKPGALTDDEVLAMQAHVRIGLEILAPLHAHLAPVLRAVADHHERWDGSGYPRRLAGEAIALGGRILAAADAYDAVTSARAYRGAMEPRTAIDYLATRAGELLDPAVYAALRTVVERGQALVFLE